MNVIRVGKNDSSTINDIFAHHIDASDKRAVAPSPEYLEALLNDDRTYLLAALHGGRVAGHTLAYRFPSLYAPEHLAYLYDIEVSLEYRRQGIGRRLVGTLPAHLGAGGVKEVWLGTAVDNVEGQALFQATGAVKSEETFNDYTYYLV